MLDLRELTLLDRRDDTDARCGRCVGRDAGNALPEFPLLVLRLIETVLYCPVPTPLYDPLTEPAPPDLGDATLPLPGGSTFRLPLPFLSSWNHNLKAVNRLARFRGPPDFPLPPEALKLGDDMEGNILSPGEFAGVGAILPRLPCA